MDSGVLALTAMAAYRPRRWRGAVLPRNALIEFEIINGEKRPVSALADNFSTLEEACSYKVLNSSFYFNLYSYWHLPKYKYWNIS